MILDYPCKYNCEADVEFEPRCCLHSGTIQEWEFVQKNNSVTICDCSMPMLDVNNKTCLKCRLPIFN